MAKLESRAAFESRLLLLRLLAETYTLWWKARTDAAECAAALNIKQTKPGLFYVYRAGARPRRALAHEIDTWTRCKLLRENIAVQRQHLKDIDRLYRAAGLPRVPAGIAKILRELDGLRLLGRHVYVVGDAGRQSELLSATEVVYAEWESKQIWQFLVLSNEAAFVDSCDLPLLAASATASQARQRDCNTVARVTALVQHKLLAAGVSAVVRHTNDQLPAGPQEAFETFQAWCAQQWEHDDTARTTILLDDDGVPVPVVVPGEEVFEMIQSQFDQAELTNIIKTEFS